jgi:hypothetical protein
MKNFILTPVKPVHSQLEENYGILLTYVQQNFDGLLIGAKRREECSNDVQISGGESIIRIKTNKGSTVGLSKIALTYGAGNIRCEKALHDVYTEIMILKDFAEDPEKSKYSYTIDINVYDYEDIF